MYIYVCNIIIWDSPKKVKVTMTKTTITTIITMSTMTVMKTMFIAARMTMATIRRLEFMRSFL